jgi:hypothetical protein
VYVFFNKLTIAVISYPIAMAVKCQDWVVPGGYPSKMVQVRRKVKVAFKEELDVAIGGILCGIN